MDLSIVIVSWNVKDLLIACLESVFAACKALNVEIIVVDNKSSENTVTEIESRFPRARVIANDKNVGFAAANNQALMKCTGQYILLLNPDPIVVNDAIIRLITFMETHPDVGLVGPRLDLPNGEIQITCARSFPTPIDWFWYFSFIGQVFRTSTYFGRLYLS